jgi:hypothetical protein
MHQEGMYALSRKKEREREKNNSSWKKGQKKNEMLNKKTSKNSMALPVYKGHWKIQETTVWPFFLGMMEMEFQNFEYTV